jgi:receptor protein-tyrosine kinase
MELLIKTWTKIGQRWQVVAACVALALLGAVVYQASAGPAYTASTEIFLRAPDVKTSAGAYQGDLFSRQRAQTYVKLFESDDLAKLVIDKLGLTITPHQLVSKVSATAVKNTVLMVVSVTLSMPRTSPMVTAASWAATWPSWKISATTPPWGRWYRSSRKPAPSRRRRPDTRPG